MTHRFPEDFWAERQTGEGTGVRFDASLPQGLKRSGPYGVFPSAWPLQDRGLPFEDELPHFVDETALDDPDLGEDACDRSYGGVIEDWHPDAAPTGVFLPEKYEPNYPYPLILWLHDAGGDESEMLQVLPRISERNYFGLSLRGGVACQEGSGFDWSPRTAEMQDLEKVVYQTVCEMRRNFHIHSERIFLAGVGTGATTALRLMLQRPEWFGGVFALGGQLPELNLEETSLPDLAERRIFQTVSPGEGSQTAMRWQAAGVPVVQEQQSQPAQVTPWHCSQFNHWIMESICDLV